MGFTKYTGTVAGSNGSLITALDAILVTGEGWVKTYGDANNGAYTQAGGCGFKLRVEDDGPGAGGADEARITGYETMSDIDTGTGPFPTAAQGVGGVAMVVARKSPDANARNYKAWADDRTIIFMCETEGTAGQWYGWMFGDFYSFVTGDAYNCMICGRSAENTNATASEEIGNLASVHSNAGAGFFIARGHTGAGGSVLATRSTSAQFGPSTAYVGTVPYPNPADGGLYLSRVWISDTVTAPANGMRGRLRGLWCPCHPVASYNDGDTITGVGDLAGKTFELVKNFYNTSSTAGVAAIETSDTLETN